MPAKIRNEPRFKPFIGRFFTLRQHKEIPCFHNNKERVKVDLADFGEAVLVIDESNTRVKVTLTTGSFVWIPKFFLHKEIKNGLFKNVDGVSESIQELLSLAEDMKKEGKNFGALSVYAEELERIANSLRQYADEVSPTGKRNGVHRKPKS